MILINYENIYIKNLIFYIAKKFLHLKIYIIYVLFLFKTQYENYEEFLKCVLQNKSKFRKLVFLFLEGEILYLNIEFFVFLFLTPIFKNKKIILFFNNLLFFIYI